MASRLSLSRLYHSHRRQQRRRYQRKTDRRFRTLAPETLEARIVLASITWTGDGDGISWGRQDNWDLNRVPISSDEVAIPDVSGTSEVRIVGNNTVASIDAAESVVIYGGTLTLRDGVSEFAKLQVSRQGFFAPGHLVINGDAAIVSEMVQLTGSVGGAGELRIEGPFTWAAGEQRGSGETIAEGGLNTQGDLDKSIIGRTVITAGTSTYDSGRLNISSGGELVNEGTFNIAGNLHLSGTGTGSVINNGTLAKTGGTGVSTITRTFTNDGVVDARVGELSVVGTFGNFGGNRLSGGTYLVSRVFSFAGADIQTNDASIILNGTNARIRDNNLNDALVNFESNAANGSFQTQNGRNFTTSGDFTNAGNLIVGAGTTFKVTGDYTQTAGTTLMEEGGTINVDPPDSALDGNVAIEGGVLKGTGTINGNVINQGLVSPGDDGGVLNVTGNYTQTDSGTLDLEIGGAFTIDDVEQYEGQAGVTNFVFTVSLSLPSDNEVSVQYETLPGTTKPTDLADGGATGTLTFAPGVQTATITVGVNGDLDTEDTETFSVRLFNPSPGAAIGVDEGVGTILNDDVSIKFDKPAIAEGNAGQSNMVFTLTLNEPSPLEVSVDYKTVDGTATVVDQDYIATSGSLTWAPGETTKNITVQVIADTKVEEDEDLIIELSNAKNAEFPVVPGLVSYWPMDGNGDDIVGGRNGSPEGGVSFGAGHAGEALYCDGTASALRISDPGPAGTADLDLTSTATFAGWVYPTAYRDGDIIINKENSYEIAVWGNSQIYWAFSNTSPGWAWIGTGYSMPLNTWSFFAITYDNGLIKTYDGEGSLRHTFNGSGSNIPRDEDFKFCARGGDGGNNALFRGRIDEFGIFNQVLEEEVIADVADDFAGAIASNTGKGTILNDDSLLSSGASFSGGSAAASSVAAPSASSGSSSSSSASADEHVKAGFDQLIVGGSATLAGTLNVTTVGGFNPGLTDVFSAIAYGSVSGDFGVANVNLGGGKAALTAFEGNRMLLMISPPQVLIDDVSALEGDHGTTDFVFTVEVGEAPDPITVDYATRDDTATVADGDYIATAGKLTFEPGETSKTITVSVNGDTNIEGDETFWVDLSNASPNSQIQDNAGLATILRDDPRFVIDDAVAVEGNSGTAEMVFNIDLSIPVSNQVSVDYQSTNGPGGVGLVSYWPGEGNGDDIVGGRNGEVRGATFVDGRVGQAFWCDGDDYIHVNDPGPEGSADLDVSARATFTGFIHPTSYRDGDIIINKENSYEIAVFGSGTLQWAFRNSSPGWAWINTGFAIPLNEWSFYAITYDNGLIQTWDGTGTVRHTFTGSGTLDVRDEDFRLCARGGDGGAGSFWRGGIDEQRIYNTVLTAGQLADLGSGGGGGAAFAPTDYTPVEGTLVFEPGETHKEIRVPIAGDTLNETDEIFFMDFANANNAILLNDRVTGTIRNDEVAVNLSLINGEIPEKDGIATVQATLSQPSLGDVVVELAFSGSATGDGADYIASNAQIVVPAGTSSGTISLSAVNDSDGEANETIIIDMVGVSNAIAGDVEQVTVTILDDDDAVAPKVVASAVNGGLPNRSRLLNVEFEFDQEVTINSVDAIKLTNHSTGSAQDISGAVLENNGSKKVTLNLAGVTLPNSFYTIELPKDGTSVALAESYSILEFALAGDLNGDRSVNFVDFGLLSGNFGQSVGTLGPGDTNGDGTVNFVDFGTLSANFGAAVTAPSAPSAEGEASRPSQQDLDRALLELVDEVAGEDDLFG